MVVFAPGHPGTTHVLEYSGQSCRRLAWINSLLKGAINENVVCASPARVNGVKHAIPIPYATHVRYSPGLHRGCTGAVPALYRADRRSQSRIADLVSL